MKKMCLMFIAILATTQLAAAQWVTNNTVVTTTSPVTTLDVNGGVQLSGVSSASPPNGLYYGLFPYTGVGLGIFSTAQSGTQGIGFWTRSAGVNAEVLRITSVGKVGIGTTNPSGLLSLGSSVSDLKFILQDAGNYKFGMGTEANQFEQYINNGTAGAHFSWGNMSTDGNNTFSEFMRLTTSGNLGIGTTDNSNWQLANSPYKLNIAGGVIATSVTIKMTGNWPDYVFKKSYILPLLTDLKAYIELNHHLPGMPSALAVKDRAINLGEIDMLLTKKVEELTLYLIEEDKKEEAQKQVIKNVSAQLATAKAELAMKGENDKQLFDQLKAQQGQIDQLKQQLALILKKQGN